jgi:hypothetical protein
MTQEDLNKLVGLVSALVPLAIGIASTVISIVQNLNNLTPAEKADLITRIRAAQSKLPEWE